MSTAKSRQRAREVVRGTITINRKKYEAEKLAATLEVDRLRECIKEQREHIEEQNAKMISVEAENDCLRLALHLTDHDIAFIRNWIRELSRRWNLTTVTKGDKS